MRLNLYLTEFDAPMSARMPKKNTALSTLNVGECSETSKHATDSRTTQTGSRFRSVRCALTSIASRYNHCRNMAENPAKCVHGILQNSISAMALLRTLLGQFTMLPRPPSQLGRGKPPPHSLPLRSLWHLALNAFGIVTRCPFGTGRAHTAFCRNRTQYTQRAVIVSYF